MVNMRKKGRKYRFQDLVDITAFDKILDDLYGATQLPSAIIDLEGNVLAAAGLQRICIDFHRKNPEAEKLCIKSDTHIQDELKAGEPCVLYECPHGLVDLCCPVIVDGHHLANVFTGQVLHAPLNDETRDRFRTQAGKFGFHENDYLDALSEVPVFPIEKHQSTLVLIASFAGKMAKMGLVNVQVLEKTRLTPESENRYGSLFNNNHTVMLLIDPGTGNIVDANPAACSFYGYNKEEFCNMAISDINCFSTEQLHEEMTKAKEDRRNYFFCQHRLADGAIRDVEVYSDPVVIQGRELLYLIAHDVTRRVKAEAILAKVNEEWRNAMDFFDDAVCLVGLDSKVVRANKTFYEMVGLVSEKVIGQNIISLLHPEGEPTPCPVCDALSAGKNVDIFMETDHPNNPFEHPIEVMVKMIRNTDGDITSMLIGIKDLGRQKKIEQVLRRGKEEWEKTFDAMSDIITIQDKDMRIIRANKAAHDFFKVEPGQLNRRYCYDVFRGADSPCGECPGFQTLRDLTRHVGRITHANLEKTFSVSSDPVFDALGNLKYIVHIAQDITEHLRLEEDLFQAQKMEALGTLAGGIAHDFNNLLAAILGYAELAQVEIQSGARPEEDIEQVIVAAKRATDLVKQILTFSRQAEHPLQPLKPHIIINESLRLLRSSLPATVQIEEDIDSECGLILADKAQLNQVMMNTCTNAVHAMLEQKGILRVTLCRREVYPEELPLEKSVLPGSFIVLSISDTGHGMDEATSKRIFDPYFTTKGMDNGTGLGLAVTLGIIKNYNGFIRVDSEPGKGTTFYIYFPVLQKGTISDEKDPDDNFLPEGDERILFIDDESTLVKMNKLMFERLGYNVTGETDSRKALDMFRTDPDGFDLIVTDMTMPYLTGFELAREVLNIDPAMPIILCTGYSSMITEEDVLKIGIREFVSKPIRRNKLAKTVRMILDEGKELPVSRQLG